MKRTSSFWTGGLLVALSLIVAGCVSYDRHVAAGQGLDGVKRFFVLSNQNDNHGIDRQIEAGLKIRGYEATTGPLTMLPDDAQVIVSYDDRWTWDFGDHLYFLQLTVRDRKSTHEIAAVRFSAKIPKHKTTPAVIGALLDDLFAGRNP